MRIVEQKVGRVNTEISGVKGGGGRGCQGGEVDASN